MIEYIFMIVLTISVFVFVVMPCLIGIIFDHSEPRYIDQVKLGINALLVILFLVFIVFIIGLIIAFIDGDPNPISTLIGNIKKTL